MYRMKEKGRRIWRTRAAKKEKKKSSSSFFLTILCLPSSHIPYAYLKQGIQLKCWYLLTSLYSVLIVKTTVQIFTAIRIISDNIQKTLNQHEFACTCNNKCEQLLFTHRWCVCMCVCVCARAQSSRHNL
jgi:hypothetical protein